MNTITANDSKTKGVLAPEERLLPEFIYCPARPTDVKDPYVNGLAAA